MVPPNERASVPDDAAAARARRLVQLFFSDMGGFGEVREVAAPDVPQPCRRLLDHRSHMTVTMEAFVGGPSSLRVLDERRETAASAGGTAAYAREIELLSPSGEPIQYGIVRIDLGVVPTAARERILSASEPLGRVLIESGTLRDVHDVSLVAVAAGPELARRIGIGPGRVLHGRVATISLSAGLLSAGSLSAGFAASAGSAPDARAADSAFAPPAPQVTRPAVELLEIPLVG